MCVLREIAVGVDSGVASERVMDRALWEAESSGRGLHVVHASSTPVWLGGGPGFGFPALPPPVPGERYARELVDELLAKGLSHSVEVRTELSDGGAAGALWDEAGSDDHLRVLGSRGQRRQSHRRVGRHTGGPAFSKCGCSGARRARTPRPVEALNSDLHPVLFGAPS